MTLEHAVCNKWSAVLSDKGFVCCHASLCFLHVQQQQVYKGLCSKICFLLQELRSKLSLARQEIDALKKSLQAQPMQYEPQVQVRVQQLDT